MMARELSALDDALSAGRTGAQIALDALGQLRGGAVPDDEATLDDEAMPDGDDDMSALHASLLSVQGALRAAELLRGDVQSMSVRVAALEEEIRALDEIAVVTDAHALCGRLAAERQALSRVSLALYGQAICS